jgi:hypothetical protein
MSDPKRWTDPDAESSDIERLLCAAGQQAGPPPAEKQRIWSALAQATLVIPPAIEQGLEAAPSAGGSALGTALRAATKLSLGVAAVGALATGAHFAFAPAPVASTSVAPRAPQAAPSALPTSPSVGADAPVEANELALPSASVRKLEASASRASNSTELRETQLREESLAVLEIRRVLRAGNTAAALALLEQARARFAHPVLGQEREALTIEALARSGSADAARRRANAFLRSYPKSPYAADIRALTSSPTN